MKDNQKKAIYFRQPLIRRLLLAMPLSTFLSMASATEIQRIEIAWEKACFILIGENQSFKPCMDLRQWPSEITQDALANTRIIFFNGNEAADNSNGSFPPYIPVNPEQTTSSESEPTSDELVQPRCPRLPHSRLPVMKRLWNRHIHPIVEELQHFWHCSMADLVEDSVAILLPVALGYTLIHRGYWKTVILIPFIQPGFNLLGDVIAGVIDNEPKKSLVSRIPNSIYDLSNELVEDYIKLFSFIPTFFEAGIAQYIDTFALQNLWPGQLTSFFRRPTFWLKVVISSKSLIAFIFYYNTVNEEADELGDHFSESLQP